ncbi:MAG: GyrI-like domain-containing protein [Reyranella sp.]|nr:GyrI-like domain-containing protein [Reyranella sp.]
MSKLDFKKTLAKLYSAPTDRFVTVDVPILTFVKVDGAGDPNTAPAYKQAIEWLYAVSYALKFAAKGLGKDYVVPPLEGLWWADDPADFTARRKDRWRWTLMIMAPDVIDAPLFDAAVAKAGKKLGDAPPSLRLEPLSEGRSLQIMHLGSYDDEGPILARLHDEIMPAEGLTFAGPHHEIYLGDPARPHRPGSKRSCANR